MKKIITITKEWNNPEIEQFIKKRILPNTKRYEHNEFSLEEREEVVVDANTTQVISKTITLNSIQEQNFSNIYFENCLFNKARISKVPLDKAPQVEINATLKNCCFVNCALQDFNSMKLENCTFIIK